MTTELQLLIAQDLLDTGLVHKVYHSCQLIRDRQGDPFYPVYPHGAEYRKVVPDDTEGLFAYIRVNGDYLASVERTQSCGYSYFVDVPARVVCYCDKETSDHAWLLQKLLAFAFRSHVRLVRVIDDKWRLVREETPVFSENFDGQTFFVAMDVLLNTLLLPEHCALDAECTGTKNPLCV